jgi:hypothetical protein
MPVNHTFHLRNCSTNFALTCYQEVNANGYRINLVLSSTGTMNTPLYEAEIEGYHSRRTSGLHRDVSIGGSVMGYCTA